MKKYFFSILMLCFIHLVNAQADSSLKEYTGRYIFEQGNVVPDVTVTLEGEQLSMSSTAGSSVLEKLGIDSFSIIEFSGTAVFKRNETAVINGVHIEAAGYVMDGTKEVEGTGWNFRICRKQDFAFLNVKREKFKN
jgi:hypothetical protein